MSKVADGLYYFEGRDERGHYVMAYENPLDEVATYYRPDQAGFDAALAKAREQLTDLAQDMLDRRGIQ